MKTAIVFLILIIFLPVSLWSQQPEKQTIEERLIRFEAGQQNLEQRLEDFRSDVNTRFAELRTDMNQRFDDFQFWLQIIFGAVIACLGAILIQWMIMWKRIAKVEAQVEDRIVLGYREEELREIKRRIEKLEAS
jgi:hypothetical protein